MGKLLSKRRLFDGFYTTADGFPLYPTFSPGSKEVSSKTVELS